MILSFPNMSILKYIKQFSNYLYVMILSYILLTRTDSSQGGFKVSAFLFILVTFSSFKVISLAKVRNYKTLALHATAT